MCLSIVLHGADREACMDVQVGVFSATLPPEALEITRKFMNKPVRALLLCMRGAGLHACSPSQDMHFFKGTGT